VRRSQIVAIVIGIAVASVVVWLGTRNRDKRPTSAAAQDARGSAGAGANGSGLDPDDDGRDDGSGSAGDSRYRVIDADARLALMQRIKTAREAREARESGKPAPAAAPAPSTDDTEPLGGSLNAESVKDGIMEILPLFEECYTAAVERGSVKTMNVTFDMTITGEPDVGTLVDHAEIGGDAAVLADTELTTCLHETMMSVELPPTTKGVNAIVKTGMAFTPGDDPPGDAAP
jgi:hypothetical protein